MHGYLLKTIFANDPERPRYLFQFENKVYSRPKFNIKTTKFRCFNEIRGTNKQKKHRQNPNTTKTPKTNENQNKKTIKKQNKKKTQKQRLLWKCTHKSD